MTFVQEWRIDALHRKTQQRCTMFHSELIDAHAYSAAQRTLAAWCNNADLEAQQMMYRTCEITQSKKPGIGAITFGEWRATVQP